MTDIVVCVLGGYASVLACLWGMAEVNPRLWPVATAACRFTVPAVKAGLFIALFG